MHALGPAPTHQQACIQGALAGYSEADAEIECAVESSILYPAALSHIALVIWIWDLHA